MSPEPRKRRPPIVGRPTIGSTALTLYETALFKLALGATRAYVPLDDTGHVDCLTVHMYTAQWRIPLREARDVRCGAASRQPGAWRGGAWGRAHVDRGADRRGARARSRGSGCIRVHAQSRGQTIRLNSQRRGCARHLRLLKGRATSDFLRTRRDGSTHTHAALRRRSHLNKQ